MQWVWSFSGVELVSQRLGMCGQIMNIVSKVLITGIIYHQTFWNAQLLEAYLLKIVNKNWINLSQLLWIENLFEYYNMGRFKGIVLDFFSKKIDLNLYVWSSYGYPKIAKTWDFEKLLKNWKFLQLKNN